MSPPRPSPPAQVKGEGVRQFIEWYTQTFGAERLAQRVAGMDPAASAAFDLRQPNLGIVASSWYPVASFHALIDVLLADYTEVERQAFAKQAARATIEATLRGVYKFLFETMMNPDRYAARAQKLFSRFYDTGEMTKVKAAPNVHVTEIRDWTGHHPLLCDVLLYTSDPVYRALGCKNVVARRLACVAAGDALCSYEVRWSVT